MTSGVRRGSYEAAVEEFLATAVKTEKGCLLFSGNINHYGYGVTTVKGITWKIHRLVHMIKNGPIDGLIVCHKCDTPACINPDHLYAGTHKDNYDDMISRNRNPGFLRNQRDTTRRRKRFQGPEKMSLERVIEARILLLGGMMGKEVAKIFGVSNGIITNCRQGVRFNLKKDSKKYKRTKGIET